MSRDGRIRTGDRAAPSRERYQAAPRPDVYPREESNLRPQLRRLVPYPLDHEGMSGRPRS
jgi:hypothetical protein